MRLPSVLRYVGLAMRHWPRRLVFGGCFSVPISATRGIAAGSAFETPGFWIVTMAATARLVKDCQAIQASMCVDSLSVSVGDEDQGRVVEWASLVHKRAAQLLETECHL